MAVVAHKQKAATDVLAVSTRPPLMGEFRARRALRVVDIDGAYGCPLSDAMRLLAVEARADRDHEQSVLGA